MRNKNNVRLLMVAFIIAAMLAAVSCSSGGSSSAWDTDDDSTSTDTSSTATTDTGTDNGTSGTDTTVTEDASLSTTTCASVMAANAADHEESTDCSYDAASVVHITLAGDTIMADAGAGVTINGSTVTINTAADYMITGTLNDGRIIVDTGDDKVVRLILNGVNVTNTGNSPLSVMDAEKTVIILVDGTVNTFTDGATYPDDEDANAAVYSEKNLTICGTGTLQVNANYNDGIGVKDGLIISSGNIVVNSLVDDGIRGKDYLVVKGGNITVTCAGDALKSDNAKDATLGYICVEDGVFNITCTDDGFQAETDLVIYGGTFSITSGGGSGVTANDSAKGMKAEVMLVIDDGTFDIDASDDSIHSNDSLVINGGSFDITTGDDGIHAENGIGINGGDIGISKCYEGIEAISIVINDGNIYVVSSDDGLNVAGGNDSSGWGGAFAGTDDYYLNIHGGDIAIYSSGDGIDSNGSVTMTGGTVKIHGPISSNDGAIDYDTFFKMTGGFIVAAGSSAMAQTPSSTSSQYSVRVNMASVKAAGTLFHVESSTGTNILTFAPAKQYQSVVFSSPALVKNGVYNVYTGGTSTGVPVDGLYEGGVYTAGTKLTSFNIVSIITSLRDK